MRRNVYHHRIPRRARELLSAPCVLPDHSQATSRTSQALLRSDSTTKRRDIFVNSVFFVLRILFHIRAFRHPFAGRSWLRSVLRCRPGHHASAGSSSSSSVSTSRVSSISDSLERNYAFKVDRNASRNRYFTSFLFGVAFAAGWTPCAGAVLGAILGLAASSSGLGVFPPLLLTRWASAYRSYSSDSLPHKRPTLSRATAMP